MAVKISSAAAVLLCIVLLYAFVVEAAAGGSIWSAGGRAVAATAAYLRELLLSGPGMSTAASSTQNPVAVADVAGVFFLRSSALLFLALALALGFGVAIGLTAALHRTSKIADLLVIASIAGVSAPSFFLALILQQLAIGWTKRMGTPLVPVGGFGWDLHLVLPVLVLAARPLAQITRVTFVTMGDILQQDFVRTAHALGLPRRRVVFEHVLRNGFVPLMTTLVVSLRYSLSSLPVVELFFGWTGAGAMLLRAISEGDENLTLALLLLFGLLFLIANLLLDLLYPLADPRLRNRAAGANPAVPGMDLRAQISYRMGLRSIFSRETVYRLARGMHSMISPAAWRESLADFRGDGQRPSRRNGTVHFWAENWMLGAGLLGLLGLLLVMFVGVRIAPHSPYTTIGMEFVDGEFLIPPFAPDAQFPWGTDVLGRDMMSLIIAGARQTLSLALLVMLSRLTIGLALGALAGWFQGRWIDRAVLGIAEVLAAFPTLILAMLFILALGIRNGYTPFLVGLSLVGWSEVMQFVRGQVISLKPRPFVESAYATGATVTRLVTRHIVPNLLPALVSLAALEMGAVLMLLGELGFVGLFIGGGAFAELVVDAPEYHYSDIPEWAALLSNVRLYARTYLWTALYPALAFFAAILIFNLTGEGLRKLVERGGLNLNRLWNRTVFVMIVVLIVGGRVLAQTGGVTAFYREQASTFDGRQALLHARQLADPALDGRALGTAGYDAAGDYIATAFASLGLQRGADESYFQIRSREFQELNAVPEFRIADGGDRPHYRRDFAEFAGPYRTEGRAEGEVVVLAAGPLVGSRAGFSSQLPRALQSVDVTDDILLVLEPEDTVRFSRLPYQGILVVADDAEAVEPLRTLGARTPVDRSYGGRVTGQDAPVLLISPDIAARVLAGTGMTPAEMRAEADGLSVDQVLLLETGTEVAMSVHGHVREQVGARHVIGHLPAVEGQGLGEQLIVVLAQYDSPPPSPDGQIVAGANDNASGVAVMLEAIRVLQETGYRPYKTFLFIAYSGEGTEGGEPVDPAEIDRYLAAKLGFSGNFTVEAVVDLRGLGAGTGSRLAIEAGGSLRLAELFDRAAARMNVPTTRTGSAVDLSTLFAAERSTARGQDAPGLGLRWEGWSATSRRPADTVDTLDAERLEQAGRTLALGLMILGRETDY